MGEIQPKRGKIVRHPLLRIGYYSQHSVEELTRAGADTSVPGPVTALSHFLRHFEELGDKVTEQDARACLGSWGLKGRIASDTALSALSGGQKVSAAGAATNCIVIDAGAGSTRFRTHHFPAAPAPASRRADNPSRLIDDRGGRQSAADIQRCHRPHHSRSVVLPCRRRRHLVCRDPPGTVR